MRRRSDNRGYQQELRLQKLLPRGRNQSDAVNDYLQQSAGHALDVAQGFRLVDGTVVDTTGYVHNYKVSLSAGLGVMRGVLLSHGASGLFGARASNTLTVGARILCAVFEGSEEAIILGVLPDAGLDAADAFSDVITPGGNTGFHVDSYLQGVFLLPQPIEDENYLDVSGALDYSAGRPVDSLTSGESGYFSETGLGLHVDQMMAFLRVNEETGVFGFYADSLLRVSGRNLQLHSGAYEREDADDRGFLYSEEGYGWFTWETLGITDSAAVDLTVVNTAQKSQLETPWYHTLEPKYDDQQPYWRWRRWSGWLAGGQKEQLTYPPTSLHSQPNRYAGDRDGYGLYSAQTLATGRAFWESAKGLTIGKRAYLPTPKRKKPVLTDPVHPESYTELEDGLKIPPGLQEPDSVLRAADYIDQHSYASNYEGYTPFLDLEAYVVDEESDLVAVLGNNQAPAYADLASAFFLDPPSAVNVQLRSDRYQSMKIYPNNAFLHFTEDGGIVLTDGWGSEIRMTSGHIVLAAAGDIWLQSGRNINHLAGFDFVARAQNSADLSAAQHDVRIKAQKNCMILGGNDVCGGVLIESKTPGIAYDFSEAGEDALVTGIVLKTTYGQIVCAGEDVVLSGNTITMTGACAAGSGGSGGSGSGSSPRQIILDAGDDGRIGLYGKTHDRHILAGGGAFDIFQDASDSDDSVVNEYRREFSLLGSTLLVNGCVYAEGSIATEEWFLARNGSIVTAATAYVGLGVLEIDAAALSKLDSAVDTLRDRSDNVLPDFAADLDRRNDYAEHGDGFCDAEFTFRTTEQYRTTQAAVYETRWQQRARIGGQSLPLWNEPTVTAGAGETSPYPGKERWFDEAAGRQIDPVIYNEQQGWAADRNGAYASANYAAPQSVILAGTYTVVIDASL